MTFLLEGLRAAWGMIATGDPAVYSAVLVSLQVSLTSTSVAALLALPFGYVVGTGRFRGQAAVAAVLHTLMSVPTVAIGLLAYALLSHRGVLGSWGWLYSKKAIVCGQVLLALPIMAALSLAATQSLDRRLRETALGLGARPRQVFQATLREGRYAYLAAVVAGFGRVLSEVGISMIVGGNILGSTRTMTTAIALETSKGEFATGIALGIILVLLAFGITATLQLLQGWRASHV